jgi:hypothetical protein
LKQYPNYANECGFTGSYVVGKKTSYGDIDVVCLFDGKNKNTLKKHFAKWVTENFSEEIVQPFTSQNYKGDRFHNAGELISLKIPQVDNSKSVQVDIIFALTQQELQFKCEFLNLPAEIQGMYLGILKTLFLQVPKQILFSACGIEPLIPSTPLQGGTTEFEFNLSPKELQIREVEIDGDYKCLSKRVVWKTDDWNVVVRLLQLVDCLDKPFGELVDMVSSTKNERIHNRVKGLFSSMVTVKSGEIGTEKGRWKQMCLDEVSKI